MAIRNGNLQMLLRWLGKDPSQASGHLEKNGKHTFFLFSLKIWPKIMQHG